MKYVFLVSSSLTFPHKMGKWLIEVYEYELTIYTYNTIEHLPFFYVKQHRHKHITIHERNNV